MIELLVAVLVICVVVWVVRSLTAAFSVPDPLRTVILVVVVLILLVWFLQRADLLPANLLR